ncbi:hypothetical protein H4219_004900 [Mycoemilia scoparia]|uniref:G protein-coupled receptor n=1 Tax=Mycoemilia scoparia TaxID=417184 RepID=A0A9W7ZQ14_9FUNG|nr:hypothetical protein H4219_004900 [Mycoemilia scoparia]
MQTVYQNQATGTEPKITVTFTAEVAPEQSAVIVTYFDSTGFGDAVPVYMAFHCISILASLVVLAIVLTMLFVNPKVAKRPSMRLSACIAAMDIGISGIYLARFAYPFMAEQPKASLYVMTWLTYAFQLVSTLLTTCIAFHLMLTVLMRKQTLAGRTNCYYELVCFTFGLAVPTASFKLFRNPIWDSYNIGMQYLITDVAGSSMSPNVRSLVCAYLWEFICIGYCVVVCTLLAFKLFPVLESMRGVELTMPEGDDDDRTGGGDSEGTMIGSGTCGNDSFKPKNPKKRTWINGFRFTLSNGMSNNHSNGDVYHHNHYDFGNNTDLTMKGVGVGIAPHDYARINGSELSHVGNNNNQPPATPYSIAVPPPHNSTSSAPQRNIISYASAKQRKQIRRTIQRILLYPIEMIVFRIPTILFIMTPVDYKFGYAVHALMSIHGIFNFVVFLFNPSLDDFWPWVRYNLFGKNTKVRPGYYYR